MIGRLFFICKKKNFCENTYTVTVENDGNGSASADKTSAAKGETVTLTATPAAGYHFKEWQSSDVTVSDNSFIMPEKDVIVKAIFEANALTGTVSITGSAKYGETLTADITGTNNTGTLSYQWKRGGADISGATNSTYTLTADDIGETITVSVSSSVETGTISSAATSAVEKADGPAAPTGLTSTACTTSANNDGKITGTTTAMEYSTDNTFASKTACTGTEITGLANGTYYVRIAETATHKAGAAATVVVNAYVPVAYTVTFDANGGSVTPTSATTGADGKLATLPTPTRSGSYRFNGWYTAASGGTKVTLDMVYTADTTIYAHWTYTGGGGGYIPVIYTLAFNTNGGSAISSVSGTYGKVIDLDKYVPTKSGFDFGGWYSDSALTNPVDEIKLKGNKTVYAKWNKENPTTGAELPFTDVKEADWSYDDIYYVWEKGLMQGTSETTFAPKIDTSRAMIVTILYRLEGEPAFMNDNIFTDVEVGSWYEKAVVWANGKGIVLGYGDGRFGPTDPVTREQMAAIMYRYAQYKGYDVTIDENTNFLSYDDVFCIDEWAQVPMFWALDNDLIDDVNGWLYPRDNATRAVVATFLHRFCEVFVK